MRNGMRFIGLAAATALSLIALAGVMDGVVMKRAPKVGDVIKYRLKAEADVQGQPFSISALITEKCSKAEEGGNYAIDSAMSDLKVNDADAPEGAGGGSSTTTYKPTGEVLSIVAEPSDPSQFRMANMQSVIFPATPLKVGDTWTTDIKKNDKGAVDAKGSYKVEAQETVGKFDTYKITGKVKESISEDPSSLDGTFWVNIKDGSMVKATGNWVNAPLPFGPTNMKWSMTRED
jgi:hypothetical protein